MRLIKLPREGPTPARPVTGRLLFALNPIVLGGTEGLAESTAFIFRGEKEVSRFFLLEGKSRNAEDERASRLNFAFYKSIHTYKSYVRVFRKLHFQKCENVVCVRDLIL